MNTIKLFPGRNAKFHFGYLSLEIDDIIFHSDSLFSALCNNYVQKYGDEKVADFIGKFPKISSLFYGVKKDEKDIYFLPKPMGFILPKERQDKDRKLTKKIKFISISAYNHFCAGTLSDETIKINDTKDCLYTKQEYSKENLNLFYSSDDEKVSINRKTSTADEGKLFNVSSITLGDDAFFYFILEEEISEELKQAIELLTIFGIGGKLSTGFGTIISYEIKNNDFLCLDINGNCFTNLSLIFPKKQELEKITAYKLIERKGFVHNSSLRKKPLVGFAEGAIFSENKIDGSVVDVSPSEDRKVFRWGKALLIPYKKVDDHEI
jgi:CRISPR-associated protein Csm4